MTLHEMIAERRRLSAAEYDAYSPEHFPGSRKWFAHKAAADALAAFDREHPDVLAAIQAERAAAPPPDYVTDPGSLYNRIRKGVD